MNSLLFKLIRYLNYAFKARSAFGIHSPFVYNLIIHTIYNKTEYYAYHFLAAVRLKLSDNKNCLEVLDYGAGSKKGIKKTKKVSQILRQSVKSEKYARLIFRLAIERNPQKILELGTSLGLSTLYLSYAHPKSVIYTIEGSPHLAAFARNLFEKYKGSNIISIEGQFEITLQEQLRKEKFFDFVFFDGNHRLEPTLNYFNKLVESVPESGLFIFDDIHWSAEMEKAWEIIKKHEKVSLTIDLFEMGLCYFMKRKQKEHFVVRF